MNASSWIQFHIEIFSLIPSSKSVPEGGDSDDVTRFDLFSDVCWLNLPREGAESGLRAPTAPILPTTLTIKALKALPWGLLLQIFLVPPLVARLLRVAAVVQPLWRLPCVSLSPLDLGDPEWWTCRRRETLLRRFPRVP